MKLLVDSVNEDNGNICRSLAMSVNELMITASCYKSGRSMTMTACYKNRVNACLATKVVSPMTSLIIIRIIFVCF